MDINMKRTALLLIGFQNDYFAEDGILHSVIEESSRVTGVLQNTLSLLRNNGNDFALVVSTPIIFTEDFSELQDPVGILKTIRDVGAFRAGRKGSETIPQLSEFSSLIREIPGKRGLNAFSNTHLDELLREHDIEHLILAGTVTSLCIDSTARSASDRGYKVTILKDCTSGRTEFEQNFFCSEIFPLYSEVCSARQLQTSVHAA